jgi:tripartite-type tricarboxylate transporter receptor subunit TctC
MNPTRRAALAAATALLLGGPAMAQDTWPSRPIKLIVPYLAGTAPDTSARTLADAMGPLLGQTIVVRRRTA